MFDTLQVQVAKVAFGRFQMFCQIGQTFLSHKLLFKPEDKDRVEAQAARIQEILEGSDDPMGVLNMDLWNDGSKLDFRNSVFKPKEA